MDDKDHVFARFKDDKPAAAERREKLTIPGRGGTSLSRSVEVVHVRTRAAAAAQDRMRQTDRHVRAASWEDGFPATPDPTAVEADLIETARPATHVMPAWEPTVAEPEVVTATAAQALAAVRLPGLAAGQPRIRKPTRRIADPFDPSDDGANCIRCGYAVEPAWEKQGLRMFGGVGRSDHLRLRQPLSTGGRRRVAALLELGRKPPKLTV